MTGIDVFVKLLKRHDISYYLSPAEFAALKDAVYAGNGPIAKNQTVGLDLDNDGKVDVKIKAK